MNPPNAGASSSPPLSGWRDRHLLPLALLAVALAVPPLLIVMKNPDFLKAHGLSLADLGALFTLTTILIPLSAHLALSLVDRATGRDWGWRSACFLAFLLFQMPLLRNFSQAMALPAGILTAVVAVQALLGWPRLRLLAALLATLAWLGVPIAFWINDQVTGAVEISTGKPLQALDFQRTETPVVFLLFDEFPLTTLITPKGDIDSVHFPNFERLARHSTWYRVTRSLAAETVAAVPPILSGTRNRTGESLLTLLRESHRCVIIDDVISLAPPDGRLRFGRVAQAGKDLAVATLHAWTPRELTGFLPRIDQGWVGFSHEEKRREQALAAFEKLRDEPGKPLLYFVHNLLPHGPYRYRESGVTADPSLLAENAKAPFANSYPSFFLQAEMTDKLLGQAIDQLEREGLWEKSLVVVVADHGRSFLADYKPRSTDGLSGLHCLYVPFFLKLPGQQESAIVDAETSTLDILPLILRGLEARSMPWPMEGKPPSPEAPASPTLAKLLEQARTKYQDFAMGAQSSVYTTPEMADWWGKPAPAAEASKARFQLLNSGPLSRVDLTSPSLPLALEARVEGQLMPNSLLVWSVNGVVASCERSSQESVPATFFVSSPIPQSTLREGQNAVALYEVSLDGGNAVWKKLTETAPVTYALVGNGEAISWNDGKSVLPVGSPDHSVEVTPHALARGGWRVRIGSGSEEGLELVVFDAKGAMLANLLCSKGQTSDVLTLSGTLRPEETQAYLRTATQFAPVRWRTN